jgi:signal peptidase I
MSFKSKAKSTWNFLKADTWQSWLVSLILIIIFIRLILFPGLAIVTGSPLPLVVVESCSMYHGTNFENWWDANGAWYNASDINKSTFEKFKFRDGLNKGDIIFVTNPGGLPKLGETIIFKPNLKSTAINPIIHRVVDRAPLQTKGDNNDNQLIPGNNLQNVDETRIEFKEQVLGKATFKIPALGWVKLIFFEAARPENMRGGCK